MPDREKVIKEQVEKLKEPFKDVVSVVRCKDCKRRNTIFCFKDEQGFGTDDNWFCADGEKHNEEQQL